MGTGIQVGGVTDESVLQMGKLFKLVVDNHCSDDVKIAALRAFGQLFGTSTEHVTVTNCMVENGKVVKRKKVAAKRK